jgi:hypothetical protein
LGIWRRGKRNTLRILVNNILGNFFDGNEEVKWKMNFIASRGRLDERDTCRGKSA